MIKRFLSTTNVGLNVARSLKEASKMSSITKLDLKSSESFVCKNMMCEHLGESCGKLFTRVFGLHFLLIRSISLFQYLILFILYGYFKSLSSCFMVNTK